MFFLRHQEDLTQAFGVPAIFAFIAYICYL